MMRKTLLVMLATLLLSACGSASVASHKLPPNHGWVLSCSKEKLSEPSFLILDCSTSSLLLSDAIWTHWGADSATGTARLGVAPCTPVCKVASMDFYPHTKVTLSDPLTVDGKSRVFQHVTLSYVFEGKHYTLSRSLS
ncbi:hypothetical protein [Ferrimicrobium acidiphilum]|uniref:hypothetical protein n=2 Tax=Ferrimicrobium acidiphilum TaxID=121039 RepID=UPI0023F2F1C2|nr:hypothetical protein [Ferrimicrobium acidiphilum]